MKKDNNYAMISPTSLYAEAERRYRELLLVKKEKEDSMTKAPAGKIHIVSSGGRTQYYLREESIERSGKYVPKSDVTKIKTYLQKAYDETVLKYLNIELKSLESFLKKSSNFPEKIKNAYSANSDEVKQYLVPIDMSDEDCVRAWMNKPYVGKQMDEDAPFFETDKKERVRSKSELAIANALAKHGIPYKYECPFVLKNGTIVYLDFTIWDVKERREKYWEHRGMMDDRDYAKQAVFKMKSLMKNGIIVGKNMVITEETATNPLGTDEIETIIREYFS